MPAKHAQRARAGMTNSYFSSLIERLIKSWNYQHICFVTIIRDKHHPLRPKEYRDPDPLWQRLKYKKMNIHIHPIYPTIQPDGHVIETENPMEFWVKEINMIC